MEIHLYLDWLRLGVQYQQLAHYVPDLQSNTESISECQKPGDKFLSPLVDHQNAIMIMKQHTK